MKSFKFLLIVMLSSAVLVGCKKKGGSDASNDTPAAPAKTEYEKYAAEMCVCSSDMLDLTKEMQKLSANPVENKDALDKLMAKFESTEEKATKCAEALDAKYPKMKEEAETNEEVVMAAMKKECPAFMEMLESVGGMPE